MEWDSIISSAFFISEPKATSPPASEGGAAPPLQYVKNKVRLLSQETHTSRSPTSSDPQAPPTGRSGSLTRDQRPAGLQPDTLVELEPQRPKTTPRGEGNSLLCRNLPGEKNGGA